MNKKGQHEGLYIFVGVLSIIIVIGILMATMTRYTVWQKGLKGEASLREAEWDRQIQIKEAEANLEAEKLNAQSEVERARGVAEANKIIGEGLKNNEEYIKYLWVKGLSDGNSEVIYVPTEANIPIMEAGRIK